MNVAEIVTVSDVRAAVLSVLQANLPTALTDFETGRGLDAGYLPQPRTWVRQADFLQVAADQLPAVFVTSPGVRDEPTIGYDGTYTAVWPVRAFCVLRGSSFAETSDKTGYYVGVLRWVLNEYRIAGLDVEAKRWASEPVDVLDADSSRTIAAASADALVTVTAAL